MEDSFAVVAVSNHFPRGRIAVVVCGAVDCVDVYDEHAPGVDLKEEHAPFEIPVHGLGFIAWYIAADERADAVHFAAEASRVVLITREAEMRIVEGALGIGSIGLVQGLVDVALDGGLGGCVCGGDFDFLEAEDVGPCPSLEIGAEGRGWRLGFRGGRGWFEKGGYWRGGEGQERMDAVDVPRVDA